MLQENVQLQLLYDPFTSLMKRIKVVSSTYNVIIIIYIITLLKNDRISIIEEGGVDLAFLYSFHKQNLHYFMHLYFLFSSSFTGNSTVTR